MSSLHASEPEVAHVFHLPLSRLVDSSKLRKHMFRGFHPYWAVNVTDLVESTKNDKTVNRDGVPWAPETGIDEVGEGIGGKLEVWGLTGWYINVLMRALGILR